MSMLGAIAKWCLVVLGALYGLSFVLGFVYIQALPSAQVEIHGVTDASPELPVTMTVRRSGDYGLTAMERAQGLDPLNDPVEQEVALAESFSVTLPPAYYCTRVWPWAGPPPPPIVLTLTFSDAPDEQYTVVKRGRRGGYFVRTTTGLDVAPEQAAWKLAIGEPVMMKKGYASLWEVELRVERQSQSPREGTATA